MTDSARPQSRLQLLIGLIAILAVAALSVVVFQQQRTPGTPSSDASITVGELPRAARDTLALIEQGGPFPYRQDGQTFRNREGLLPEQPTGYYREYTVKEGRRGNRGPLRIVMGRDGDAWWTADHYQSFRRIDYVPSRSP